MNKKLILGLALGALASVASAAPINCSVVSSPTELNANIVCPDYNGGGTLSSIVITITGTISGSISLTNNASISENVQGTTTSSFFAGAIAGFVGASPLFSDNFTTGLETLTAGQTKNSTGLTSGVGSGTITDSSVFGAYTGAGTFNVPVSTLTGFTLVGGGGQVASSQVTNAMATATVMYNVSGAPEPGTAVLGLTGLAGVVISFLRRRKSV